CQENKTKKTLIGTWAIENIDFIEDPYFLERSDSFLMFSVNLLSLNGDETCILPVLHFREMDDMDGSWTLHKKDEGYVIHFNSINFFFNGEFVIKSLEVVKRRGGHFYVMTLLNQLCVIELNRPVY